MRLVISGNWLPRSGPLGLSIKPAGPSFSNAPCHLYSVCGLIPTSAAKSLHGRPLRSQVSRSRIRCSGLYTVRLISFDRLRDLPPPKFWRAFCESFSKGLVKSGFAKPAILAERAEWE